MNLQALTESLIQHEGMVLRPYRCASGKTTIGIGRNLDDNGITEAEALHLLSNDIQACIQELDRTRPAWRRHSDERQNVLIEMVFNMGMPSLNKFSKMWAALDIGDYDKAAYEMLNSNWAVQVTKRAKTLSDQMRAG